MNDIVLDEPIDEIEEDKMTNQTPLAKAVEELRPNCGKLRNVHGPLMGLGYAAALDDILAALATVEPTNKEDPIDPAFDRAFDEVYRR